VTTTSADLSQDTPLDPAVEPGLNPPSPPTGETRRVVSDLPEDEEEQTPDKPEVTELTDSERRDFASLMTCGRRSKTITVMGHPVVIQTLNTADEMRVGLFTKSYADTQLGFQRAYQVGVCAAGIREVQGKPLSTSLRETTSEDEIFDKSVEAVQEFYPIVITQIYQAIMDLEREFAELAIKLGKLSG
jgi:hypothetical protein